MQENKYGLLIVDDQNGVRRLLFEAFNDEGYQVRMAGSGMEALKMLSQEMPDLVLLDIKMPVMSGIETLGEIRKASKDLPVLMMTAYGDLEVVDQAKKLGVKHYIIKPFDLNEVKMMVKGLLMEIGDRPGKLKEIG
ncbi:MAG: chemotaxis protein CheY [Peptococcaceae bacterium BICA1-7]|nr:MAG: chemotaxis protein CheY [Peptococcaceae bacterium BICA1-7]HBV96217.1 response regulator [Desulfotomaculum sp.]